MPNIDSHYYSLDYYSSDDEFDSNEISIENIPREIDRIYKLACSKGLLDEVKNQLLSLLNIYKIDIKFVDFQNKMMTIYDDVIENYLYYKCPQGILDANSYNLKQKFVEWALTNTKRGIELDYLDKIYVQLINS